MIRVWSKVQSFEIKFDKLDSREIGYGKCYGRIALRFSFEFFYGSIRIVTKVFLNITLYVQFTFRAQN